MGVSITQGVYSNSYGSHLKNFACYLRLDMTQQRDRVLGEVSERKRVLMESAIALFKRKSLVSLDYLLIGDD